MRSILRLLWVVLLVRAAHISRGDGTELVATLPVINQRIVDVSFGLKYVTCFVDSEFFWTFRMDGSANWKVMCNGMQAYGVNSAYCLHRNGNLTQINPNTGQPHTVSLRGLSTTPKLQKDAALGIFRIPAVPGYESVLPKPDGRVFLYPTLKSLPIVLTLNVSLLGLDAPKNTSLCDLVAFSDRAVSCVNIRLRRTIWTADTNVHIYCVGPNYIVTTNTSSLTAFSLDSRVLFHRTLPSAFNTLVCSERLIHVFSSHAIESLSLSGTVETVFGEDVDGKFVRLVSDWSYRLVYRQNSIEVLRTRWRCPGGTYLQANGTCSPCPLKYTHNNTCHTCPARSAYQNGKCARCPIGYYCSPFFFEPQPCPPGTLCLTTGMYDPKDCSPGYFCPDPSIPAIRCPAGSFCRQHRAEPEKCPPDYFCPDTGMQDPIKCQSQCTCPSTGLTAEKGCVHNSDISTVMYVALGCLGAVWCTYCVFGVAEWRATPLQDRAEATTILLRLAVLTVTLFDQATDILVCIQLFNSSRVAFWFSIVIFGMTSIASTVYAVRFTKPVDRYPLFPWMNYVLGATLTALPFQMVLTLNHEGKVNDRIMLNRFKILDAVFESAPQLVLQLSVMFIFDSYSNLLYASTFLSVMNISMTFTRLHFNIEAKGELPYSHPQFLVAFCFYLCHALSRVAIIALVVATTSWDMALVYICSSCIVMCVVLIKSTRQHDLNSIEAFVGTVFVFMFRSGYKRGVREVAADFSVYFSYSCLRAGEAVVVLMFVLTEDDYSAHTYMAVCFALLYAFSFVLGWLLEVEPRHQRHRRARSVYFRTLSSLRGQRVGQGANVADVADVADGDVDRPRRANRPLQRSDSSISNASDISAYSTDNLLGGGARRDVLFDKEAASSSPVSRVSTYRTETAVLFDSPSVSRQPSQRNLRVQTGHPALSQVVEDEAKGNDYDGPLNLGALGNSRHRPQLRRSDSQLSGISDATDISAHSTDNLLGGGARRDVLFDKEFPSSSPVSRVSTGRSETGMLFDSPSVSRQASQRNLRAQTALSQFVEDEKTTNDYDGRGALGHSRRRPQLRRSDSQLSGISDASDISTHSTDNLLGGGARNALGFDKEFPSSSPVSRVSTGRSETGMLFNSPSVSRQASQRNLRAQTALSQVVEDEANDYDGPLNWDALRHTDAKSEQTLNEGDNKVQPEESGVKSTKVVCDDPDSAGRASLEQVTLREAAETPHTKVELRDPNLPQPAPPALPTSLSTLARMSAFMQRYTDQIESGDAGLEVPEIEMNPDVFEDKGAAAVVRRYTSIFGLPVQDPDKDTSLEMDPDAV